MPSSSWYERNKEKSREYHARWRSENVDYDKHRKRQWYDEVGRERDLLKKYGINSKDYQTILMSQEGSCAICNSTHMLAVDHNHETGKVRGILCYECNRNFIGKRTDPELYKKAAEYLSHSWQDGKRSKLV